jgi:hypothetical protein
VLKRKGWRGRVDEEALKRKVWRGVIQEERLKING